MIAAWSALCNAECMRYASGLESKIIWIEVLRRGLEYALAFGLALLSSHWILRGN